ncbi:MAG: hypothetical protein Q9M48_01535 [Rhodobacterales bacterium]|nr:hypothetical protein [Rhodobacterales bacterium]
MYGVVLWSDTDEQKAVIWCEDHGDLAFYNAKDDLSGDAGEDSVFDGVMMDAGDLVHFEISEKRHLRYVRNPRLISEDEYSTLAQGLNHAAPETANAPVSKSSERNSATIIPFGAKRRDATAPEMAMTAGF